MNSKLHKELWVSLLILILLSVCNTPKSMSRAFSKEGLLPVIATGMDKTKEEALKAAFRDAVGKAVGVYIDSTTMVEKVKVIEDKILRYAGGYVKKYTILEERLLDDGIYLTRIQAFVVANNIELDLTKNKVFKIESKDLLAQATTMLERNKQAYEIAKDLFENYPNNAHKVLVTKFDVIEVGLEEEATVEIGVKIFRNNLWYNRFENLLEAMNDKTQRGIIDLVSDTPIWYDEYYNYKDKRRTPLLTTYPEWKTGPVSYKRYVINFAVFEYIAKRADINHALKVSFYDCTERKIGSFFGELSSDDRWAVSEGFRPLEKLGFNHFTQGTWNSDKKIMEEPLAVLNQSKWNQYLNREFFYRVVLPFNVIDNVKDIKVELTQYKLFKSPGDTIKYSRPIERKK